MLKVLCPEPPTAECPSAPSSKYSKMYCPPVRIFPIQVLERWAEFFTVNNFFQRVVSLLYRSRKFSQVCTILHLCIEKKTATCTSKRCVHVPCMFISAAGGLIFRTSSSTVSEASPAPMLLQFQKSFDLFATLTSTRSIRYAEWLSFFLYLTGVLLPLTSAFLQLQELSDEHNDFCFVVGVLCRHCNCFGNTNQACVNGVHPGSMVFTTSKV